MSIVIWRGAALQYQYLQTTNLCIGVSRQVLISTFQKRNLNSQGA